MLRFNLLRQRHSLFLSIKILLLGLVRCLKFRIQFLGFITLNHDFKISIFSLQLHLRRLVTGDESVSNSKGGSSSMFFSSTGPFISVGKPLLSGKRCRKHILSDNNLNHSTTAAAAAARRRLTTNPTSTKKGHKHRHNRHLTTIPTSTKTGHKHRHNSS
ncbi:putative WRKY transcription factor 17 [Forsythia ovata]|uniref:WRKY transcription factor 17 n=1 Tax=Forsythia ovata TaxID=205694 RepID=A0ABD1SU89_9LAMI